MTTTTVCVRSHVVEICRMTILVVSLVDGYNLPMRINNNVGCGIPSCPVDLGPNCSFSFISSDRNTQISLGPTPLKGPFDSSGFPVGCACQANLDGNKGLSAILEQRYHLSSFSIIKAIHRTAAPAPTTPLLLVLLLVSVISRAPVRTNHDSTGLVTGITYYSYFKDNCTNSYAFVYDEPSGTALWTCQPSLNADYTVTFCPPS